jgi:hypothetical protein
MEAITLFSDYKLNSYLILKKKYFKFINKTLLYSIINLNKHIFSYRKFVCAQVRGFRCCIGSRQETNLVVCAPSANWRGREDEPNASSRRARLQWRTQMYATSHKMLEFSEILGYGSYTMNQALPHLSSISR